MTKFGTLVSLGAAALLSAVVFCAYAQDDLDDLLKDLEGTPAKAEEAKPAEEVKPAEEAPAAEEAKPSAEEPAPAEEKAEEKPAAEETPAADNPVNPVEEKAEEPAPAEEKAEEPAPAEEPAAEEPKAEEPAAEEPKAEEKTEEPKAEEAKPVAEEPVVEAPVAVAEPTTQPPNHPTTPTSAAPAAEEPAAEKSAEDALDDIMKDLEDDAPAKPAAEEPKAEEEKPAEEPAAEEKAEEQAPVAEEPKAEEAPAAEEKAEEAPAAEEKTEEPAGEEKAEEEKPAAEETPAGEEKAEEKAEEPAPAEEPAAEEKAEEAPAAEEPKAEEVPAVEEPAPAEEKAEEAPAPAPVAEENPVADNPVNPVEKTAAQTAPVAAPPDPDAELLENIRNTERLRRTVRDVQARKEIAEARAAMKSGEYADAVKLYNHAKILLGDAPSSKALVRECEQGVAEGLYRHALNTYSDLGDRKRAIKLMEAALASRHPKAKRELDKWYAEESETVEGPSDEAGASRQRISEADYKADRDQIRRHLRRSRQFLAVRDMRRALEECEVVLVTDPYNQDAIRIRDAIQRKRQTILEQQRIAARDGIIADVDAAWRPAYAVNVARLDEKSAETVKAQQGETSETTTEQDIEKRMKDMRLPTISFKPPATIIDAVDFFRGASKDYDRPDIPLEKRGFNFVLRTPQGAIKAQKAAGGDEEESDDFSSGGDDEGGSAAPANGLDPIPTITASDISFHEALTLVCESVGYKFIINGPIVMVMPKDMSTAEIIARKYNVPESFMERVSSATDEMKQMGGSSFGSSQKKGGDSDEESPERDWKAFFEEMGVKWPEGSSIKHIKSLGKLYVRNTRENLAEFEKVLEELGGQPQLIEIETRFVEVSQEDLNSLGFEWILNSDYSLNLGSKLGKALGIRHGVWGSDSGSRTVTGSSESSNSKEVYNEQANGKVVPGFPSSSVKTTDKSSDSISSSYSHTANINSQGGKWVRWRDGDPVARQRAIGINAFGGTDAEQGNGNRYLSTDSNPIAGESKSINDQFMRVNAFLGQADLSMILHMLSQRSDTDLLSAPKVVTKSGENAVIKVVTEYIYPQDYDVQLQSSGGSSSGGSSSGGGSSAILAVVEPQNFTMREVGVILDVTPTYSEANGGTIDLELKPQVVDEPTWKNYGMKIPFSGNSSQLNVTFGQGPFPDNPPSDDIVSRITERYWNAVANFFESIGGSGNMTWYDAPMEQPFFHVRSIDSKVSITPGATVVMGGLITEQRRAMDDKIPFLGDLPFIGRLFRSHAEQTIKRNLLIFVTGRLITPSGRELRIGEEEPGAEAEVKPAPEE